MNRSILHPPDRRFHLKDSLVRISLAIVLFAAAAGAQERHPVPREHPRLLGSRAELQALARQRPAEYQRVVAVARRSNADDYTAILTQGLVAAIEEDETLGRRTVQRVLRFVDGPVRSGHVPFAHDLAASALAYDLCFEWWTEEERERFHTWFNRTVDANVESETHVFHNGWYGYKHWGIGLAGYASFHENPRSPAILEALEHDFRTRAAPALELAGDGGGWAEGYYIHYWLYEWLFFCEVARRCEGLDYYSLAPRFFRQRAVASMFEMYPGRGEYDSRRPVPMGDGGGRLFGGDRDKALSARRILVNHFRDDPAHQAVHAFNETTPRVSVGDFACMDFLWRDATVPKGDLGRFKLSHYSAGPGHVHARSSWDDDATHLFFKCSDRFTAHQHLDAGHFTLYHLAELAGDGGHYDAFGSRHDVNYHLRSIAHSTVLVFDPAETWPAIRAGLVTGNDGGQHHRWPHHNGAVVDPEDWHRQRAAHDVADLLAFEDHNDYLHVAADATRAYSANKLEQFTRQLVFLRPNILVVLDRVTAARPEFRKTWVLQAMKPPEQREGFLVVTHGPGRLFVQTLLPLEHELTLATGEDLYRYDGQDFPPGRDTGPAPECRIEISPLRPGATDLFLHVLTTAAASVESVPAATARLTADRLEVEVAGARLSFPTDSVGGEIVWRGRNNPLSLRIGSAD